MNSKLLRSLLVMHGDTNANLAEYVGSSENSVSNKINERGTEFRQGEIARIIERYGLDPETVNRMFFEELVSKLDT